MNAVAATTSVGSEALLVTAGGYEQLRSKLENLSVDGRRQMRERLREAREDGHLADNPPLYDLLVEQAQLERRIATLRAQLAAAQVVVPTADGVVGVEPVGDAGADERVPQPVGARRPGRPHHPDRLDPGCP